jgi:2-hydroxychromene-2-carboxylate isomerase
MPHSRIARAAARGDPQVALVIAQLALSRGRNSTNETSTGVLHLANESDAALTGAAFELANAGYTPMSDPDKKDSDEAIGGDAASLREAAEQRAGLNPEVNVRGYVDRDGEQVAQSEAITLERAARDYAAATSAERLLAENQTSEALAAKVDALRAEALAKNPDAAELFGFELPEAKSEKAEPRKSKSENPANPASDANDAAAIEGLDPELAKALQHPQVAQAIEERLGETEKVRQDYIHALSSAQRVAQMSILSQIPELVGLPPESVQAAFADIASKDPARFARVQALIATTQQMFAQQQQENRRSMEIARQNFSVHAKAEDARFDAMLKGEPKATQQAVTSEIFAAAKESGLEPSEFVRLFNSEPLMRNAAFQKMMYEAGKFRLMTKAKHAASAKALPQVVRPGMSRSPAERNQADLRALSAKLSNTGDIRDAVALYNARKSGRR